MKNKNAAMEMSVGTIVTIVLLMTVLILGMVFVKNIMCSGIILTDQITNDVENGVRNLFGTNEYGIKCMGEAGQEVKLGDGGKRQIACIINVDTETNYKLSVKSIESLKGVSTEDVNKWILDKDWTGVVKPGEKTVTVLVLEIPKSVSATTLKIQADEENADTGATETHTFYIDVVHIGGLTSAIC